MVKLFLKNKEGNFNISQLVPQISWSGNYQQCARSLDFSLLSSPLDKHIPMVQCDLGNSIVLMQDDTVLFEGYIFERTKNTGSSTINIACFDRGIYLKRNKTSYKFTNQTPEAIAKRICDDFDIEIGEIVDTGVKISRNFLGSALYDIIQTAYTLASYQTKKKYYLVFKGAKLYVLEKKVTNETLVIEGGSNLMDASTSESISNLINQVTLYDKDDNLIRHIKNDALIKLYGVMQDSIRQSDGEDAGEKAQEMLDNNGLQQKITINNLGNAANVSGGTVVVREPYTGLYGLFYIDQDTHTWKNGLYLNQLVINFKNLMDEKEVGSLPNKSGEKTAG